MMLLTLNIREYQRFYWHSNIRGSEYVIKLSLLLQCSTLCGILAETGMYHYSLLHCVQLFALKITTFIWKDVEVLSLAGNSFNIFLASHSFSSLKFSVKILLSLLILPTCQPGVKYEVIHRMYNQQNVSCL